MFCNYCSTFYEDSHDNSFEKKEFEHLCHNIFKEKNISKIILDYKKDLEYEIDIIDLKRFDFLESYNRIDKIEIYNYYNKYLEIIYKDKFSYPKNFIFNGDVTKICKYQKKYKCEIILNKNITFDGNYYKNIIKKCFKTLDIPIHHFLNRCVDKNDENFSFFIIRHLQNFINDSMDFSLP